MEILNNREIATAVWLTVCSAVFFCKKEIRSSFRSVLNVFAKKTILIPFGLLIFHTLAAVWVLDRIGIWDSNQIKNAILWFVSVAGVSFFRLPKIADDPDYFKKAIVDNLKIVAILEFLITFYTFSLAVEFVFVPFVAFLAVLLAVSQTDEKYALVEKVLNSLLGIIGVAIIVYAGYRLITDFGDFAQVQTFYDFTVPIALSMLLLPLIYVLHVYMVYEGIFARMQFSIKDKKLRKYAKKTAVTKYHLNIPALRRWADALSRENIENTYDVDKLHKEISRLEAEEKDPPAVPFDLGWSPYTIALALQEMGLKAGKYKKLYENEWFASSPYLEIGGGILPNNIAYYLKGNKKAVSRLKLKMNINEPEQAAEAHATLCELASILHLRALGEELGYEYKNAILNGNDKEGNVNSKTVRVVTEHWPNEGGYDVDFSISNIGVGKSNAIDQDL